ncbi:hypothetical protein HaLaN_26845 [Haematococcus lacustris]|uniref:TPT domain-containing protein n=1 Tax=Haematococcus lacustris TaxID=44745 RepID=A0A6A0A860_HAELA|nr:hypothetical protein HaLaN_26845 [Haematococcus lacustris]
MIYSLFMVLPVGLVRGLATAKHNLEADGQEDEDDDMLAIAAGEASGGSEAVYLTWPLLLWGLIVIITSIITHKELITVQSSIFVYNSVNFVSLIAKISLYTWQAH